MEVPVQIIVEKEVIKEVFVDRVVKMEVCVYMYTCMYIKAIRMSVRVGIRVCVCVKRSKLVVKLVEMEVRYLHTCMHAYRELIAGIYVCMYVVTCVCMWRKIQ